MGDLCACWYVCVVVCLFVWLCVWIYIVRWDSYVSHLMVVIGDRHA